MQNTRTLQKRKAMQGNTIYTKTPNLDYSSISYKENPNGLHTSGKKVQFMANKNKKAQ